MKLKQIFPLLISLSACSPADYADMPGVFKDSNSLAFSDITGINFGETIIGDQKEKTLTINNNGKKPVSGLGVTFSEIKDLQIIQNSCVGTLAPGKSCEIRVSFSPSQVSSVSGSYLVTYTENNQAKSKNFPLLAQAVTQAELQFSLSTLSFGDVVIGSTKKLPVLISNSGGATAELFSKNLLGDRLNFAGGEFPGVGGTCSLKISGNSSCVVVLDSSPLEARNYVGSFAVSYFDGKIQKSTSQLPVNSIGKLPAQLVNLNETVEFIQTVIGSSAVKVVSVKNSGMSPAKVNTVTATGAGLSVDSLSSVASPRCGQEIAVGEECSFVVKHTPTLSQQITGNFSLSYNNGVENVSLTSQLIASSLTPSSVNTTESSPIVFESSTIGIKVLKEITFQNTGEQAASLFAIGALAGDFSFNGGSFPGIGGTCSDIIQGNSTCKIVFSHTASFVGQDIRTINFSYNNGLSTVSRQFTLSASAIAEASLVFLAGDAIDAGRGAIGTTKNILVDLKNLGQAAATDVSFSQIDNLGSIGETSSQVFAPDCLTLAPTASCSVPVLLSYNELGELQTKLTVSYRGQNGTLKTNSVLVLLSSVQPAQLAFLDGGAYDYGSVFVGEFSEKSFLITNLFGEPAQNVVSSIDSAELEITASTCGALLSAGESCLVSVRFIPRVTGALTFGSLTASYNNGVEPASTSITLSGVGGAAHLGEISLSSGFLYDFGAVSVGQKGALTVTVSNIGTGVVRNLSIGTLAAPFARVATLGAPAECGDLLLLGDSCSLTIEYTPTERGLVSQDLAITYHNGLDPIAVALSLSGTGKFPAGTVDELFGTNGQLVWTVPGSLSSYSTGMRVLENGKIVVAGTALIPEFFTFSARFNSDGALDTTYGNQNGYFFDDNFGLGALSYKAIAAPGSGFFHFGSSGRDFMTSKITQNGAMTINFGINGYATRLANKRPDYSYSGVVLPDGKILSVGTRNEDAYIERMNPNGSLDPTFNGSGSLSIDMDLNLDELRFVGFQSSGKYVFGGGSMIGASGMNGTIFRANSDGTLDSTFAFEGKMVVNSMGIGEKYITDAVVLPDDRILALVLAQNNPAGFELAGFEMYLAMISPDGGYDETFNNGAGFVRIANWGNSGLLSDFRMLRQADGKILIAGNKSNGLGYELAVMRLLPDFTVDAGFGNFGEYVVPNSESFGDYSVALALQPDGEIILGGKMTTGFNSDSVLITRIHQ